MIQTRRVILLRHGQTDWNAQKRFQGHSDIPLNEAGIRQARHAARLLALLKPDAIVASDLQRAAVTAQAVAENTGLTVEFDKRLRERGGGSWEGLTRSEIRARWPEEFLTMAIPDGEDMQAVGERVCDAVEHALTRVPEHGVLVAVSHGAALRAGINHMLGFPPEKREALGPLGNCSWSMLGPSRSGDWRLLEHNAASLPDERAFGDDR